METNSHSNKRPAFLTILCILSFIGLGMSVFNKLTTIIAFKSIESFFPLIEGGLEEAISSGEFTPNMESFFSRTGSDLFIYLENLPGILGLGLTGAIIALVGAIFMWQLKRLGFYMYLSGRLIVAFSHIIICGSNFFAALISASDGFLAAIFIVLYAVNFKHFNTN